MTTRLLLLLLPCTEAFRMQRMVYGRWDLMTTNHKTLPGSAESYASYASYAWNDVRHVGVSIVPGNNVSVLIRERSGLLLVETENTGWFTEQHEPSSSASSASSASSDNFRVHLRLDQETRRIVGVAGFATHVRLGQRTLPPYSTPLTIYMPQSDEMYLVDRRGRYYHLMRCMLSRPQPEVSWTYFLCSQVIGTILGILIHKMLFF